MANNVLFTPQVFTRAVLMNLGGYLSVCRNMSKEYSKEFAKNGAKVGDTVSVKKPQRFQATSGLLYQPQPLTNIKTTVSVGDVTNVHFEWDSIERTLTLDDIQENYAKPAAIALSHDVNSKAAQYAAQNTFNLVGTPGTTPTTLDTYLLAGDKLVELGLPAGEDLTCIINRRMSTQFVLGNKSLFNPSGMISGMIERGGIGGQDAYGKDPTLGYRWERDQTIYNQVIGAQGGTPLISGSGQTTPNGNNDVMTLATKGWSNSTAILGVGDRFTIAGVYSVHPQTRQTTGDLQQFVVLAPAISNGSGLASLTVAPGITPSGQYQNVTITPNDGTAITVVGGAGAVSPQGLLLHRNAYAFVSVPLSDPKSGKGVEEAYQETDDETGVVLSFIRFFDGTKRIHGNRFDMLTGFATLYRELACVIAA
jgi:hypothetical protein